MNDVPVIDISAWETSSVQDRRDLAEKVNEACINWGFLLVSGHGVPQELIARMFAVSYGFFDLSDEEKSKCDSALYQGGRGYFSIGKKALARTKGDLAAPGDQKETFWSGAEPVEDDPYYASPEAQGHYVKNVWPERPEDMAAIWTEYRFACQRVAETLMSIFATALELPADWFADKIDKPISTLVIHHYPEQKAAPVPGALRAGAHTDFGSLTLLMTEKRLGGLQVMGRDETWHDIDPVPGAFIVNIGDLMERWTNDTWRSTLHRVVNPPASSGSASRRLSLVYFHTPNYDAEVSCFETLIENGVAPKYPSITAGAHHRAKIARSNTGQSK